MGNNRKLQFAIRAALAAAAATAVAPAALSQTAPAAATAPDTSLQEVVVTGSRIQSPNLSAISPISSVSAGDIQATGLTRVEDILNNLPMVFAGQNSTVSNGSDGTATVNLRGLGPQRTLVLVNGRRLGPGAGDGRNFSDINQIPTALIDRIDILTGGASAVYGADAVAGVVNFVLNTHFQGVRVDASYDFYNHSNRNSTAEAALNAAGIAPPPNSVNTGFGKNASILMGSNFADDKGNATFYGTYDRADAVLQAKFDYSGCTLDAAKPNNLKCGGSGTSAKNGAGGYFQAYSTAGAALYTNTVDGLTGQFRPFTQPGDLYNFGPLNFYQRPNERWTAGAFVNYDINEHVTAYGETMFTRNTSQAQIAPSGDFFNLSFIPCSDPLLTAQEAATICSPANLTAQGSPTQTIGGVVTPGANLYIGRRNAEGGGRIASFSSNAQRIVVGLKGDFAEAWKYDVFAQHSTVDGTIAQLNYLSNAAIVNATDVILGPALLPNGTPNPLAGQPECASVINGTDKKCVPWNIWVPHGVTAAATNYLSIPLIVVNTTTEELVSGSVTGDLSHYGVKLPTADEGMKVSFGAEWRSESATFSPDLASQQGIAAGAGGATLPVAGNFHVKEVFTEFGIPLLNHLPGAQSLAFEGGYRYSDYSEGFKTNTYKFGLEWAPIEDVRLRGSYQRAVRAPNILELYTPRTVLLDGSTDPCAGSAAALTAKGLTPALCALTGVNPLQFGNINPNPAAQYNGLLGGTSTLTPEKSDTYSVGLVFQPTFVPHLTMSVDWFDIKVADAIGPVGGDIILQNCLSSGSVTSSYCSLIHRDANGSLWKSPNGFVNDVNVNNGSLSTKGVDVKANYRWDLTGYGSLAFGLEGTKLISLDTQPVNNGPSYDCTGLFGVTCGAPNPSWRHVFNTTWSTPWDGLDVTLRWRYLSSSDSQYTSSDPQLTGKALPLTSHIPAYNYIDLTTQFALYKTIRLQLGVNNITDKDPPIVATNGGGFGSDCPTITGNGSSCNGNTFPGTYDALGRFFFAHITAQF
jgi:iron complex outermembrane recepter protein